MKLLYATSIRYPSALANRLQVVSMSRAFAAALGKNFILAGNEIKTFLPGGAEIVNFGVKKSWRLAPRILHFAKEAAVTHIYCREARLLFFIVLFNKMFFRLSLRFGYEVHALLGRSRRDLLADAFLARFVAHHFFVTKALAQIYSDKYHLRPGQAVIVPDAVDLSIFDIAVSKAEARRRLGLPTGPIVGFGGRLKSLNMDKGVSDILQALKLLPPRVRFVAVGGSDDDIAEYRQLAERLGLQDRVEFVGHVSQEKLALYQKAFDILLMPFPWRTHFAYYMSPLKMFEYMAARRPIIATDLPSVREILNERNALIVPPGQPHKLMEAIKNLLQDRSLAQSLAETAFRGVQNHTWQKRAEKIMIRLSSTRRINFASMEPLTIKVGRYVGFLLALFIFSVVLHLVINGFTLPIAWSVHGWLLLMALVIFILGFALKRILS